MPSLSIIEQIPRHPNPDIAREQYVTPLGIIKTLFLNNVIQLKDKNIIDLGCGTGPLAIATLILGAKYVLGVDIDRQALNILQTFARKHNFHSKLSLMNAAVEFLPYREQIKAVSSTSSDQYSVADMVVMNPPFGTKRKGIDVVFLRHAFSLAPEIISIHKYHPDSRQVLKEEAQRNNFAVYSIREKTVFHLPPIYKWYRKDNFEVEVDLLFFKKIKKA